MYKTKQRQFPKAIFETQKHISEEINLLKVSNYKRLYFKYDFVFNHTTAVLPENSSAVYKFFANRFDLFTSNKHPHYA